MLMSLELILEMKLSPCFDARCFLLYNAAPTNRDTPAVAHTSAITRVVTPLVGMVGTSFPLFFAPTITWLLLVVGAADGRSSRGKATGDDPS